MKENKMGKVNVTRGFSWEGLAGSFIINVDDKEIGQIGHLKTETFDLPFGEHTIYIHCPGMNKKCRSVKKTFVLSETKPTVNVNCKVWAYGLLLVTALIKQEGYIDITVD